MLLNFNGGIKEITQHIRLQAVFCLIPFVDFSVLHQQSMCKAWCYLLDMMRYIQQSWSAGLLRNLLNHLQQLFSGKNIESCARLIKDQ
ncbi:hypothetical protein D3C71_1793630 [compost metagenome]